MNTQHFKYLYVNFLITKYVLVLFGLFILVLSWIFYLDLSLSILLSLGGIVFSITSYINFSMKQRYLKEYKELSDEFDEKFKKLICSKTPDIDLLCECEFIMDEKTEIFDKLFGRKSK